MADTWRTSILLVIYKILPSCVETGLRGHTIEITKEHVIGPYADRNNHAKATKYVRPADGWYTFKIKRNGI